jgi:hypothetical protein
MKIVVNSLLIVLSAICTSCEKPRECKGDELSGDIISKYENPPCNIISEIDFPRGDGCLITDTLAFRTCFQSPIPQTISCINDSILEVNIDFRNYSLIGKTTVGACQGKTLKKAVINHQAKTIEYTVTLCKKSFCKSNFVNANLVIIPKVTKDYKLKTIVK